jgi:hypothetical protein
VLRHLERAAPRRELNNAENVSEAEQDELRPLSARSHSTSHARFCGHELLFMTMAAVALLAAKFDSPDME